MEGKTTKVFDRGKVKILQLELGIDDKGMAKSLGVTKRVYQAKIRGVANFTMGDLLALEAMGQHDFNFFFRG